MPTFKQTHEEFRQIVCAFCLCKAYRPLSENHKNVIRELFEKYDKYDDLLPGGICASCKKKITEKFDMTKQKLDYEDLVRQMLDRPPITRNSPHCSCKLCEIGSSTLKQDLKKAMPQKRARGRPRSTSPLHPPKLRCDDCWGEIGPGLPHNCGRREKLKNIEKTLSPKTLEQLASKVIKSKVDKDTNTIQLKTGGPSFSGKSYEYYIFFLIPKT